MTLQAFRCITLLPQIASPQIMQGPMRHDSGRGFITGAPSGYPSRRQLAFAHGGVLAWFWGMMLHCVRTSSGVPSGFLAGMAGSAYCRIAQQIC
eukprot:3666696-Amphidinium_carterae.1